MSQWKDSPLTRCSSAAFPLLVQARDELYGVGAPQASALGDRIGRLMAEIIDLSADVEIYANKWFRGDMAEFGQKLREATTEYDRI